MRYVVVLLLAACASQPDRTWQRAGASQQDFYMESGQCRAQAISVTGPLMQQAVVYSSCLQGKGWYLQ